MGEPHRFQFDTVVPEVGVHRGMCGIAIGIALHIGGASSATLVPADCAIKLPAKGMGRAARNGGVALGIANCCNGHSCAAIRCAFHFVYLCSCRDAVFMREGANSSHPHYIAPSSLCHRDLNLLSS